MDLQLARQRLDQIDPDIVFILGRISTLQNFLRYNRVVFEGQIKGDASSRAARLVLRFDFVENVLALCSNLPEKVEPPSNLEFGINGAISQLRELYFSLFEQLSERMKIAVDLTKTKLVASQAIVQPDREEDILKDRTERGLKFGISPDFSRALFRAIMDESVSLQREYWIMNPPKKRILTGVRPTGPLHLGHYVGALENWLKLQREYECFFLIADYQALGDYVDDSQRIRNSVIEVALDWLAVGLDPEENSFVIQSYIPEHAELTMLLSMLVSLNRLQRNPTLKKEIADLGEVKGQKGNSSDSVTKFIEASDKVTVGFFNYPVSQAADILLPQGNLVPVGEDQLPHIELTREIASRFNRIYGHTFPLPEALKGRVPRLVGTDGSEKMSKSRGNVIQLKDDPETVRQSVMKMFTDPTRKTATDPGHVEGNPVFEYHDLFNPNTGEVAELKARYIKGQVGDVEVKQKLVVAINNFLDPIRDKRAYFEARPNLVREALLSGTERERKIAQETMHQVREAMGITRYGE